MEKFDRVLSEDDKTRESFDKLVAEGCKETTLWEALFLSSYSWSPEHNVDSELSHILRGLDSTTRKLLRLAEGAEALMNVQSVWVWSALNDDLTSSMVAEEIRDAGRALLSARSKWAKFSQVVKPEVKRFLKAMNRNLHYECALARYVKKKTGHQYDRRLARLLVAAHRPFGRFLEEETLAKNLRLLRKNEGWRFNHETAPINFS
jgi:hypothetical protein